jgi:hypothetical protein
VIDLSSQDTFGITGLFTNLDTLLMGMELLFSFRIIIIAFILLALGTSYELTVDKEFLTYQMLLLQIPVYKRNVNASQISQMKFKRFGWIQTGGVITKKGFTMRNVGYKPQSYLIRLEEFAEENGIPIMETAGYIILKR